MKRYVQITLDKFTEEKKMEIEEFVPVDRVDSLKSKPVVKKRGRPRKYPLPQPNPVQQIEVLDIQLPAE